MIVRYSMSQYSHKMDGTKKGPDLLIGRRLTEGESLLISSS